MLLARRDYKAALIAASRRSGFGFALVGLLLVQQDLNVYALGSAAPNGFGFALVGLLLARRRCCTTCGCTKKKNEHYQ